ncbi:MAG: glycosyltransferase [Rickettsiella sp.]|nr:glycosyltransferase [Rickettsiella sp.]
MRPLFSIILTTYNRSHFLQRAIRSVLQQTFTNFELIIIDDYSTDNTQHLVEEFSDERIIYIQQPKNQGVSTARNTGIHYAIAIYLCFLDVDDEYLRDFLKEICHFLEKKQQAFIGFIRVGIANIFTINNLANGKEKIKTEIWDLDKDKNLLFITKMAYVGLVYHRLCFERAGFFNSELNFAEDLDLVLRMLAAGMDYAAIPKVLINIHIHAHASLSRSIDNKTRIKSLELFLFNHDKFINQHIYLWLYYYTKLCGDYYLIGKKQLARKLVRSILKRCWYYPKIWEVFLKFEFRSLKSILLNRLPQ